MNISGDGGVELLLVITVVRLVPTLLSGVSNSRGSFRALFVFKSGSEVQVLMNQAPAWWGRA